MVEAVDWEDWQTSFWEAVQAMVEAVDIQAATVVLLESLAHWREAFLEEEERSPVIRIKTILDPRTSSMVARPLPVV
jgi:hypothetical protein